METTGNGDEGQVEERAMSGGRDGKSWNGFEDEGAAVEEVSNNGAKGSENTFGISFTFAGPLYAKG